MRRENGPASEDENGSGDGSGEDAAPIELPVSLLGLAPGTPFMGRVEEALRFWACQRLTMPKHRGFSIEISGATVPVRFAFCSEQVQDETCSPHLAITRAVSFD